MAQYLLGPSYSGTFFGGTFENCLKMAPPGMQDNKMWETFQT